MGSEPTPSYRELGADDADSVRRLHSEMTAEDSYLRFFGPRPKDLTTIAAAVACNDPTHFAIGAFADGRLVGVANCVELDDPTDGEIAMVVAHDEQLHGIGSELLRRLTAIARRRGLRRLTADVLAENGRIQHLLKDVDVPVHRRGLGSVVHVCLDVGQPDCDSGLGSSGHTRAFVNGARRIR